MLNLKFSNKIEVGCDEAGRGCLAGPVVAAAVLLPENFKNQTLNDSKKLNEKQREKLEIFIKKEAVSYGIGIVSPKEIDEINILKASFLAMHRAIDAINSEYQLLLIDGNRFNPYKNITHECIIKGDGKFLSIAAASVLAKTERDRIMKNLSLEFPQYHWGKNKGYPTKKHREAIQKHGANKYHRKSFKLLPKQLKLF
ncbi:MAG: ribonuclease HII [Flavobacteriales bacterium]|nr:ribonuclease HII [Flavobacteriales bacterium]